ncbi:MAG: hypothetical protein JO301_01425 [Chitinophagaceae bacterium]|nr:hypothetical protein [Chitinophagaceae bacterium]
MKVHSAAKDPVLKARMQCRRKFLFYFKKGFADPTYLAWERDYKQEAADQFQRVLNRKAYEQMLKARHYDEIAQTAVRLESRTNLLFSFEKMALRDAVKPPNGAKAFATGLFEYVYGSGPLKDRFEQFTEVLDTLPRIQTRVLTWPLQTVFGFIGNPSEHIFLKPRVTRLAAEKYHFDFIYRSRPNWETYSSLLQFAEQVKQDMAAYKPKDYIDLQSFIWVMGSDEYPD